MLEQTRLPSMEEAWGTIKALTTKSHPQIGSAMVSPRQFQNDASAILLKREEQWIQPPEPVTATQALIDTMTEELAADVEALFGEKFTDRPQVTVLKNDDFVPAINAAERVASEKMGYGYGQIQFPPTAYASHGDGKILMPERYCIRTPKDETYTDFDVEEHPWDRPFLQTTLTEEIAHVMFRQLRGEWKERFYQCLAAAKLSSGNIRAVNEAIALRVKALNVLQKNDRGGIYAAAEVIMALQDPGAQLAYRGVEGLSRKKTLPQISMVDSIHSERGEVKINFDPAHPNHRLKMEKFLKDAV